MSTEYTIAILSMVAIAIAGYAWFEKARRTKTMQIRWLIGLAIIPLSVLAPYIQDINVKYGMIPALGFIFGIVFGWFSLIFFRGIVIYKPKESANEK